MSWTTNPMSLGTIKRKSNFLAFLFVVPCAKQEKLCGMFQGCVIAETTSCLVSSMEVNCGGKGCDSHGYS